MDAIELRGTVERVGEQSRVDPGDDFAPAPDAYTLVGASARAEVPLRTTTLRFGLAGHNLLDTVYREYTSLIRYYADQPGRDIRLRVGVDF
jgi:iron complex outermembrane receptor protein